MTEEQKNQDIEHVIATETEDDEINLLEYLLVIVKYKKMILTTMVITFILACVVTLLMPNIYESTAKILPPQQEKGGLGAMLGGMGDLAALAGISVGGGSGDLYVGMLQSRTIANAIIDRFDLMMVYNQEYRVNTYENLSKHVDVSLGKKDGIISISVEDNDPQRAADIANAYVEELKKLNVQFNLNNAGRERHFLENQLQLVKADLTKAEDNLKTFQEINKAIRIDDQATAIIEAISKLKGELASKEVELGVLLSSQTEQNPEVKMLRQGIAEIKEQVRKLEQSPAGKRVSDDIFITTSEVPDLGVQYARLMRDFKIQETLFELLTKQYEVAKISETKNMSTIQVLDLAQPPDRKSKPRRSLIVLIVTFLIGMGSMFWTFVLENLDKLSEEDQVRLSQIKSHLRFWHVKW